MPLSSTERSAVFSDIKNGNIFTILDKKSESKIKEIYNELLVFGPQSYGQEATDRMLSILVYELSRRQNRKSFWIMFGLTLISIGLALFQTISALQCKR